MDIMTDYKALIRALRLIGFDFEEIILHDGRLCINVGSELAQLNWHFNHETEEFIGNFVWNKSESLGFDEDGSPACCCEDCKEMKERIIARWGLK